MGELHHWAYGFVGIKNTGRFRRSNRCGQAFLLGTCTCNREVQRDHPATQGVRIIMRTRTSHRYAVDPLRQGSVLQLVWQLSTTLAGIAVILTFASLFALAPATPAYAQDVTIIYVDAANGNDSNTGATWAQAFANLQTAITATTSITGNVQIWVAAGTYYPDQGTGQTDDDRTSSFRIRN
mgnify:CR=1 FL=1